MVELEREKHELKYRLEDLRVRLPGPDTPICVGMMWMLDQATLLLDVSDYMVRLADARTQGN
jgi:hypothetical protein